jgi:hypothetical protein
MNFTELISRSSTCAYYMDFPFEWFLAQLWPLNKKDVNKVCPDYSSNTIRAISMKVYRIDKEVQCLCIKQKFFAWMIFSSVFPLNENVFCPVNDFWVSCYTETATCDLLSWGSTCLVLVWNFFFPTFSPLDANLSDHISSFVLRTSVI